MKTDDRGEHPLRRWRRERGVTRAQLAARMAEHLGHPVTTRSIAYWEDGARTPRLPFLRAIVRVTNGRVGADSFYGWRAGR